MTALAHPLTPVTPPDPFAAPKTHPFYDTTKRAVDGVAAGAILFMLSPLWLGIAAAIRLTSRGPILFTRTVMGRGGQPFVYYKFRTMRHNNDDSTHRKFIEGYVKENRPFAVERDPVTGEERKVFKVVRDPRVTPIGRLLRKLSLDEVPQLINVLRGEMSLVGPRPPVQFEYELYDEATRARLSVLPGISGWAQVVGRGQVSFDEMVALDLEYVRRRSLLLDLKIMVRTLSAMTKGA